MVLKMPLFPSFNPRVQSSLGGRGASCRFDLTWNCSVIRPVAVLDVFLACQPVLTCKWLVLPWWHRRLAHLSAPQQKWSMLAGGRIGAS